MNAYQKALYSQSACNLSGLVYSLPKIADEVWAELRSAGREQGPGTTSFNTHPIMRLFAEQFMHLTRGKDWQEAYRECETRATE